MQDDANLPQPSFPSFFGRLWEPMGMEHYVRLEA